VTIFIIDNGLEYSSRALYFVEAPEDFESWFESVLLPWLKKAGLSGEDLKIVGTCDGVRWKSTKMQTMTYQFFLADDLAVGDYNYDESPPEHRPLYRGA